MTVVVDEAALGGFDAQPGGPALAAAVEFLDPTTLIGQDTAAWMRAGFRVRNHADRLLLRALREACRARADITVRVADEFAPAIAAANLGWSTTTAGARLEIAVGILERMPALAERMRSGGSWPRPPRSSPASTGSPTPSAPRSSPGCSTRPPSCRWASCATASCPPATPWTASGAPTGSPPPPPAPGSPARPPPPGRSTSAGATWTRGWPRTPPPGSGRWRWACGPGYAPPGPSSRSGSSKPGCSYASWTAPRPERSTPRSSPRSPPNS